MACVNPDGTLTASARAILVAVRSSRAADEIASATGLPLFRVRSALRELTEAGLVAVSEGGPQLTAAGDARLDQARAAAGG